LQACRVPYRTISLDILLAIWYDRCVVKGASQPLGAALSFSGEALHEVETLPLGYGNTRPVPVSNTNMRHSTVSE